MFEKAQIEEKSLNLQPSDFKPYRMKQQFTMTSYTMIFSALEEISCITLGW